GRGLEGLVVAICGDILHSRVARSNALLLKLLGATVRLAGPRTLLPRDPDALGAPAFDRIEPALEGAHVVMMLRIQRERLGAALLPSLREYSRYFGLNRQKLALARPDAIVLHPGPMNRGVELADDVADAAESAILEQVEGGRAGRRRPHGRPRPRRRAYVKPSAPTRSHCVSRPCRGLCFAWRVGPRWDS